LPLNNWQAIGIQAAFAYGVALSFAAAALLMLAIGEK
jgi:hypothetical protein